MNNIYEQLSSPYLQRLKKFLGTKLDTSDSSTIELERELIKEKNVLDLRRVDLGTHIESLEDLMLYRLLRSTLDCLKMHYDFFMSGKILLESFEKSIQSLEVELGQVPSSDSFLVHFFKEISR